MRACENAAPSDRAVPRHRSCPSRLLLAGAVALFALAEAAAPAHATSTESENVLERAAHLTQSRDWPQVIALLEPDYLQGSASAEARLLLAIAYFRDDRQRDAEPLFRDLARHPDADMHEPARLFLGLIARHHGREREARRLFRDVARGSSVLGQSAQILLRPTAGQRFTAAASLRSGFDSNVPLLSSELVGPGESPADANLFITGAAVGWPLAGADLRLIAAGAYRAHARLDDFDFFAGRAGVHYEISGPAVDLGIGYAFEASALGGQLLSTGHAADLRARLPGKRYGEFAYALRLRDYAPDGYRGYSGDAHRGLAWLGTKFRHGEAALAALVDIERADDPAFAGFGVGGRTRLRLVYNDLNVRADLEVLPRSLGGRNDLRTEATTAISYALGEHVAWLLGGSALANRSTDPLFQHVKLAAYTGLELRL